MKFKSFILLLLNLASLQAKEHIALFKSDIIVQKNGVLRVKEAITIVSEHRQFCHGLVREFPTKYSGSLGFGHNVDFTLVSVLHNGKQTPYHTNWESNGVKIYIGCKDVIIRKGQHTYTIEYETNRQLGFFQEHDELYWNVTGNGWRVSILEAQATIHLPADMPMDDVKIKAFTGGYGQTESNYQSKIVDHTIHVATTSFLYLYQGLTVAVAMPKGYIAEPAFNQKLTWLFRDSFFLIFVVFFLLCLLGMYLFLWYQKLPSKKVIPLFYPPKGLTPSQVGYIRFVKKDSRFLSADLIKLAVDGYLTVKQISNTGYILKRTDKSLDVNLSEYEKNLLDTLFASRQEHKITRRYNALLNKCIDSMKNRLETFGNPYVGYDSTAAILGFSVMFLFVSSIFLALTFPIFIKILVMVVYFYFVMKYFLVVYTPQGKKLKAEIDGFILYLKTAETDRIKFVGTPPTKTPALYEKYLPYAMALGLEKQWSAQFASLFKELEKEGIEYLPGWYSGRHRFYIYSNFGSSILSSFGGSISSSSTPPSQSSAFDGGSGGGGYSGGGGGGGGGGGW